MVLDVNNRDEYVDIAELKFGNPGKIKIYKIFLVEDDGDLILLYNRILSSFGYKVIATAENGKEAVEKYKEFVEKPDIIIMDYKMPIKNGIEAGKEILALENTAKILMLSAIPDIKKIAISNNMYFLEKSFTIKELLKKLQEIIG